MLALLQKLLQQVEVQLEENAPREDPAQDDGGTVHRWVAGRRLLWDATPPDAWGQPPG